MANVNFTVSTTKLTQDGQTMLSYASDFYAHYNAFYTAAQKLAASGWAGDDATAFNAKILASKDAFDKLNKQLRGAGIDLGDMAHRYEQGMGDNLANINSSGKSVLM